MLWFMPNSFWESERKAYWNYQLSRSGNWADLAFSKDAEALEIDPLHIASSNWVPNVERAQAQFCYLHSKFSSLILMCELERYRLDRGVYPEGLEQLVPRYLKELPKDLMDPNVLHRKGTFEYRVTADGYRLTSTSRAYPHIDLMEKQVYGHDGRFEPNRLNRP
jgi:hypothetical protein